MTLSPCDRDLIQRDPNLPGLRSLLDPEAFSSILRGIAGIGCVGLGRHTYLRYKPGTSCLAGFEVPIDGQPVLVHAVTFHPDDAVKLLKPTQRSQAPGPSGPGVVLVEDTGIVISFFPNDSQLRALRRLGAPNALNKLLRRVAPDHRRLWGGCLDRLAYKPQRRFVGRLSADNQPRAVVRFYTNQDYRTALTCVQAFQGVTGFRVAPILGHDARRHVIVLDWTPGYPFDEWAAKSDESSVAEAVRATGAALGQLHAADLPNLPFLPNEGLSDSLVQTAEAIAWICPRLAERARRLAERIAQLLNDLSPARMSPIHGDFYAKQVLVDDDHIGLIDFDSAGQGDPDSDLGNFIAHLDRWALYRRFSGDRVAPVAEALLEGYRRATGRDPSPGVDVHRPASLLRLAPHCFRQRESDWAQRTEAILERTEDLLFSASKYAGARPTQANSSPPTRSACSRTLSRVEVIDPFTVSDDPEMLFLSEALDPDRAQEELERLDLGRILNRPGTARLSAIRVVRHKPGRRCLVEYDLEIPSDGRTGDGSQQTVTLIGKARARRVNRSAYDLAVQLWNNGFDDHSRDGISIPEPIGVIPRFQMWMQQKVNAVPSTQLIGQRGGTDLCLRIAQAMHKVHSCGVPPRKTHTMDDELRILHERLGKMCQRYPRWRQRIETVLAGCDALAESVPDSEVTGIHRDFYPDQVLVSGDRLYLVDFDLYCLGDPALDAGNFIGHLTELSLRTTGDPMGLIGLERTLEEAFVRQHGPSMRFSVRAYAALTLVRHIDISRRLFEQKPLTERLLQLCEDRVDVYALRSVAANRYGVSQAT